MLQLNTDNYTASSCPLPSNTAATGVQTVLTAAAGPLLLSFLQMTDVSLAIAQLSDKMAA